MEATPKILFIKLFNLVGLFVLSEAQPGVTFDVADACWFNVSGEMNTTYTPIQQLEIIQYLNETVIKPVADLPVEEQAAEIQRILLPAYYQVIFDIVPYENNGDMHFVTDTFYRTSLVTYPDAITNNIQNHYAFILPMYQIVQHVCVDGETQPDHRFILRHATKHMAINILTGPAILDPEATVNATALALVKATEISSSVGMSFDTIVLDIVQGLTDAYRKIVNPDIDTAALTEMVVGSIVALDEEADPKIDIKELVSNTTSILGVDIDTDVVVEAVTSIIGDLIPGLGKK
eukprot:TRINITY_DN28382_c0_g2_i4.p2 TRINITY_DN28382_c0_g2~~TRINITY_DN28382_c0_g2_i4.p2  ORF type:complete len:322 (-),score=49.49 TRINITY_DN28382_c0_g2_i4:399-1271(-)